MKIINYFYKWLILRFPYAIKRIRTIHKREGLYGLIKYIIRVFYRNILYVVDPNIFNSIQYRDWQEKIEKKYLNEKYMRDINNFVGEEIKFSVIFPVWNKPIVLLRKALSSVLNQYYKNWELCISDGSSENVEQTREFLKEFQKENRDKVKLNFLKDPSDINIIENSNSALEMAEADFCIFLDCDDELFCF